MLPAGKKRKNKGFLFIELMLSVLIMSIGFITILNSLISSAKAIEYSKDYFTACLLLENKALEAFNANIKEGLSQGAFSEVNKKFSWEMNAEITEESGGLKEVSLSVFWGEKNKKGDVTIVTYL